MFPPTLFHLWPANVGTKAWSDSAVKIGSTSEQKIRACFRAAPNFRIKELTLHYLSLFHTFDNLKCFPISVQVIFLWKSLTHISIFKYTKLALFSNSNAGKQEANYVLFFSAGTLSVETLMGVNGFLRLLTFSDLFCSPEKKWIVVWKLVQVWLLKGMRLTRTCFTTFRHSLMTIQKYRWKQITADKWIAEECSFKIPLSLIPQELHGMPFYLLNLLTK